MLSDKMRAGEAELRQRSVHPRLGVARISPLEESVAYCLQTNLKQHRQDAPGLSPRKD
jgi:hypothetical protein